MIDHDDAEKSKVLPLFRQQEEREEGRRRVHRNRGGLMSFMSNAIFSGGFSILPSTIKADPDPETGMPLHLLSSQPYGQKRDIFNDGPRITFTRSVAFDPNSNDIQIVFENLPLAWRRTPTNST
jgi:hypothetical protein